MKLTLKQLIASTDAAPGQLSALGKLATNEKIPVKPSYWIGKILRRADGEMKEYHAARVKLCEKHGTSKEGASTYDFSPEGLDVFLKELEDLQATEIDLAGLDPIKLDALGDAVIPPAVMATLDWMIVE